MKTFTLRRSIRLNPDRQHGQSAVEMALVLPLLLVLLLGMIIAVFMFYSYIQVTNAAREGARVAVTEAQKAEAQKLYTEADTLTTPTPTPRPTPTLRATPTPIPAGHVAPAWTLRPTGTPNPNPFIMINMTYLPNMITGEGCSWAGITGRFFDRRGDPLVTETLGVRITGPSDQEGAAAGSFLALGESGWMAQFDTRSKVIEGFVQVYYKDQPVSDLIPYKTSGSCMQNMLIIDVQQVKPLSDGTYLYTPKTPTKK